jgi:hypothetical protein
VPGLFCSSAKTVKYFNGYRNTDPKLRLIKKQANHSMVRLQRERYFDLSDSIYSNFWKKKACGLVLIRDEKSLSNLLNPVRRVGRPFEI